METASIATVATAIVNPRKMSVAVPSDSFRFFQLDILLRRHRRMNGSERSPDYQASALASLPCKKEETPARTTKENNNVQDSAHDPAAGGASRLARIARHRAAAGRLAVRRGESSRRHLGRAAKGRARAVRQV